MKSVKEPRPRHPAKVLRPEDAVPATDGQPVQSTIYRYDTLMVFSKDWANGFDTFVKRTLRGIGLDVVMPPPGCHDSSLRRAGARLALGVPQVISLRPHRDAPPDAPVDAWRALQHVRFEAARRGNSKFRERAKRMSLEHILWSATAPASGGVHGHPGSEGHGGDDESGSPGRVPVAVLASAPTRTPPHEMTKRRPVVAVLDTPIGSHAWLPTKSHNPHDYVVEELSPAAFDPTLGSDDTGSLMDPLVGRLSSHAGHGTFIAGIIRQIAPDATVLSLPVMHSDGYGRELAVAAALEKILDRVAPPGSTPNPDLFVDVVLLAFGCYSETSSSLILEPVLEQLASVGVAVVAAAGNDATTRESYPAAFSRKDWPVPVNGVGALNPNGTRAIFSNEAIGEPPPDWVTQWERGVAIVSTFPQTFAGARSPALQSSGLDPARESFDPDDFTAGFGLWHGTSFAAAVYAAKLAHALSELSAADISALHPQAVIERTRRVINSLGAQP